MLTHLKNLRNVYKSFLGFKIMNHFLKDFLFVPLFWNNIYIFTLKLEDASNTYWMGGCSYDTFHTGNQYRVDYSIPPGKKLQRSVPSFLICASPEGNGV